MAASSTSFLLLLLLGITLLIAPVRAIESSDYSTCTNTCLGNGTPVEALICRDELYDSTENGRNMRNCLLCESTSTAYINPTENDVYWFLFNQKYTIQHCFYEDPSDTSALPDCKATCLPLKPVFTQPWIRPEGLLAPYEYCRTSRGTFGNYIGDCETCVRKHKGSVVLANFMSNLQSACELKPNASKLEIVTLPQELFEMNSTAPDATAAATATATATGRPVEYGSSGLSSGAYAGIGVGVGIAVILTVAAAVWLCYRRKRKGKPISHAKPPLPPQEIIESSPQSRLENLPPAEVDDTMMTEGMIKTAAGWRSELPVEQ